MRLYDQLLEIKDECLISFHVPGHKYNSQVLAFYKEFDHLLQIDLTEIPGTDDLHDPVGAIKTSQQFASEVYGSNQTFFLVNGTTCGIYAMIMAVTSPGDKILVARDCHRAVHDAALLGHLHVEHMAVSYHQTLGIPLGVTLTSVKQAIETSPDAKAIVLTYPNYYGVACDLEAIVAYAHENNILVLVDEAHGAHLILSNHLPKTAIACGADIAVQSSHKSLPALTQASMLHVKSSRVDLVKLKFMLKLHQTSSPSYLLMTSLDIAMSILEASGEKLMNDLLTWIVTLKSSHPVFLTAEDLPAGFSIDPTKLVLKGKTANLDPGNVASVLRKNRIQLEFANENVAVFVSTIMNLKSDFEYLSKMMEMLKFKCYSGIDNIGIMGKSAQKIPLVEAIYSTGKLKSLDACEAEIAKGYLIPYPPGIPVVIPGEMITREIIEYIEACINRGIRVIGLSNDPFEDLKIEVVDR